MKNREEFTGEKKEEGCHEALLLNDKQTNIAHHKHHKETK